MVPARKHKSSFTQVRKVSQYESDDSDPAIITEPSIYFDPNDNDYADTEFYDSNNKCYTSVKRIFATTICFHLVSFRSRFNKTI